MPPDPFPVHTVDAAAPPRPSSTAAVVGVVFGSIALLIGWVPVCGSLPALGFALVGLPLGCVGYASARRRPAGGRGLPITAIALCSVGLLLAAAATIVPVTALARFGQAAIAEAQARAEAEKQRRADAERAPVPYEHAAVYIGSSPSHIAGTGFIIDTGAGLYAVTAEHPFDDEIPDALLPLDLDPSGTIPLAGRVWGIFDVQVLRLADAAPADLARGALRYPGPMPIRKGDRVAIITHDGPAPATITEARAGGLFGSVATPDAPLDARGLSGAPVVLESTGTVVGVLVGADDPENATSLEFIKMTVPRDPTERPSLGRDAPQPADNPG